MLHRLFSRSLQKTALTFLLALGFAAPATASTLSDLVDSLAPRTWVKMPANPSLDALSIQTSLAYFANSGVWDPNQNRVLWVGGPGSCCAATPRFKLVIYDEASNTWSVQNTPYVGPGHGYDANAYGNGKLYFGLAAARNPKVWNGSSWSNMSALPWDANIGTAMAYFPEAGGPVYVNGSGRAAIHLNGSWTQINGGDWGSYHTFAEYNPVHGVVWLGAGNNDTRRSYRLDANLNLTRMADAPFGMNVPNAIQVFDSVTGKYLVLNRNNNTWYEFDIVANQWSTVQGMVNKPQISTSIMAVPLTEHGAIMLFSANPREVWLYKHSAGSGSGTDVSLSANQNPVISGGDVTVSWNALNATSCTASGGWSGSRPTSGSETFTNLTSDLTLTMTCSGSSGSDSATLTVNVQDAVSPPTVELDASSSSVLEGGSVQLSWSSTSASSCSASGDWSGSRPVNGQESTGPLLENSSFTLTCTNASGSDSATVNVAVTAPPVYDYDILQSDTAAHNNNYALDGATVSGRIFAFVDPDNDISSVEYYVDDPDFSGSPYNIEFLTPYDWGAGSGVDTNDLSNGAHTLTARIFVNGGGTEVVTVSFDVANAGAEPEPTLSFGASDVSIDYGGFTTLSWASSHATSCEASGDWSGAQPVSGSSSVGPLTQNSNFILVCTGAGGTVTRSVSVLVAPPAQPTVTVTASPSSVAYEGGSQITWSSTNADSCSASGGWSGARALSGTESVGPLVSDVSYTLTCSGPGGQASDTASVTVAAPPAPVVTLNATPNPVDFNGAATLTWSAVNADSCTANGGWSGIQATSGVLTVGPMTADTTYGLVCTGDGGSDSASVTVQVTPLPAPQLTISASPDSVAYQTGSTVTWSSTNATSCTASGAWSGSRSVAGSEFTGPLTADATYSMICSGPGGVISGSATVTVGPAPAPAITFSANPGNVDFDGASTLTWSVANANSCTASGGWSGSRALTGSVTMGPLQADTSYTLTCNGDGGSSSETVTVTVNDPPPSVTLSAAPDAIAFNGTTTLSWSAQNAASCTASGAWSGARAVSGNEAVGPLSADATFNLTCTGTGGSEVASVTVTVAGAGEASLSVQAAPQTVTSGGTSVITWSSSDVDTCTASGDWSGARAVSGSETVGPLTADSTFAMTCSGSGGNVTRSATVTIAAAAPTVTLNATPPAVDFGGGVVLGWSTTGADACTAYGGWSGQKATAGTQPVASLLEDTEFVLVCTGPGGQASDTINVSVGAAPLPGITLQASPTQVDVNGVTTLTWSTSDATTCSAAGGWSGTQTLSGSAQVGPLTDDTAFSLVCSGPGGQSVETVQVQVVGALPAVTVSASPQSVAYGDGSQITWSSSDATSCTAFGAWSGSRTVSGTQTVSNLTSTSEFILMCTGPGGSTTSSAVVTVGAPPAPTVTIIADPQSVPYDGTTTLSWTTEDATGCTSFGSWSGDREPQGAEVVSGLRADSNFILLCTGPGGSTARSAQVSVETAPVPQITLDVTPDQVAFGGNGSVSWSVDFADSCTATGGWSGNVGLQGTQTVGPLYATTDYTLTCAGPGGSASRSETILVANAASLPLQTFESFAPGTSVPNWYQSGADFSLAFRPFNFVIDEVSANNALTIANDGQDFHTHYLAADAGLWSNYRFTGRMFVPSAGDRTGVTVLSGYPQSDAYYGLSFLGGGTFVLEARGTTCSGDLDTGVTPQLGAWYRYSVEAETTASATLLRAKAWRDGQSEPATWQAQCQDTSASRRSSGSVGLRGGRNGAASASRWDDLMVVPLDTQVVAPPTLSLSANPVMIGVQGTTLLTWTTSNATACTASGDWSGARPTSGIEQVGPLVDDSSFTLVCTGPGGSTSRSVAVAVVDESIAPTVTLTAEPPSVPTGGSTVLSWTSSNAAICAASGDWAGARTPNGSQTINNINEDSVYRLTCIGPGGETTAELEVLLSDIARDAQVTLIVDYGLLPVNSNVTLRWESRFTDSCTASGDWSGSRSTRGAEIVGPIVVSAVYTLTCDGLGSNGSASESVYVSYEDADSDGMPDVWEIQLFGNLSNNGQGDSDGDGLIDQQEYAAGTDPFNADTDGDGDSDYDEVQFGSDPRDPDSTFGGGRPATPLLDSGTNLPLWGFTADAVNGYSDIDGDALNRSEWEFALDSRFKSMIFHRDVPGSTSVRVPAGVMDPGVTYYVRTRHYDASGIPSLWSEPVTMTASTSYPNDSDGNGVDDSYQPPANADANANGVPDIDEGLCNLYDAQGGSVIGIETNSGVVRCYRSVPNGDLPQNASVNGELPYGTFSFRVEGLYSDEAAPARVFVTIWLPEVLDPNSGWVIYDPAAQALIDYSDNVTFNGNRAVVSYTDGGVGDKDGIVNGVIVDPSGPLVPVQATPTPPPSTPTTPPSGGDKGSGGGGAPAPWMLPLLGLALWRRREARGG